MAWARVAQVWLSPGMAPGVVPLTQVVKGDILPGFREAGMTRTLKVHDPQSCYGASCGR